MTPRRAAAGVSGKPRAGNVLVITLDQWRGDCLGAVGHPCLKTPHLDRLAAGGAIFARHYAQASPCGPARASLLTGLYQHNHRAVRNGTPLDRRHANLAQEARRAGYDPLLFGYTDTAVDPRDRDPGDPALTTYEGVLPGFAVGQLLLADNAAWLADLAAKGYALPSRPKDIWLPRPGGPAGAGPSFAPTIYPAGDSETAFLTDAVLRHLAVAGGRDWFIHISYLRPHPPFIAPEPFHAMYSPDAVPPPIRSARREREGMQHPWLAAQLDRLYAGPAPVQHHVPLASLSERAERQLRATYYGMISQVDEQIGRLMAALEARGMAERTLVAVTADHGEQLGDHWLWGKDGYFDQTYHVPLIVRDPRPAANATRGRILRDLTESVDVMPTILEWFGGDVPPACDGRSLLPVLYGRPPSDWRDAVHWEYDFRDIGEPALERALGLEPEQCNLAVGRGETYKYVHFAALPPLFFDLERDPHELADRAADPDYRQQVLAHAQEMLSWRLQSDDRTLSHCHLGPGGVTSRRARGPLSYSRALSA